MTVPRRFLAEWFEDAYQDAAKQRRQLLDRGVFCIACLIREELPTATAITVHAGVLVAVHDGEGTIWRFNDETTRGKLGDRDRATIRNTLLDMSTFASISIPLVDAGWKQVRDQPDVYRIDLPETTGQDATPAVSDRPQGTPGEDAGKRGQCDRPLICDGSGKRVNDEGGEYFCFGPCCEGGKAVHVLQG
ncbi:hypothetical protein [Streptomyces sp. TE5632]